MRKHASSNTLPTKIQSSNWRANLFSLMFFFYNPTTNHWSSRAYHLVLAPISILILIIFHMRFVNCSRGQNVGNFLRKLHMPVWIHSICSSYNLILKIATFGESRLHFGRPSERLPHFTVSWKTRLRSGSRSRLRAKFTHFLEKRFVSVLTWFCTVIFKTSNFSLLPQSNRLFWL